jgi:hypothetical protein
LHDLLLLPSLLNHLPRLDAAAWMPVPLQQCQQQEDSTHLEDQ